MIYVKIHSLEHKHWNSRVFALILIVLDYAIFTTWRCVCRMCLPLVSNVNQNYRLCVFVLSGAAHTKWILPFSKITFLFSHKFVVFGVSSMLIRRHIRETFITTHNSGQWPLITTLIFRDEFILSNADNEWWWIIVDDKNGIQLNQHSTI